MKDTEFIELLNLYLDHELTPADCARLEAEVKTNPIRRRVYEQYCRMQKACSELAADFAAEAPASNARALRASGAQNARQRPVALFALGSMAAAAAAVAIFFAARTTTTAPAGATLAQVEPAAAAASADLPTRSGGIVHRPAELRGDSIFLVRQAPGAGNAPVAPQLAWLTDVQVASPQTVVSAEALRFEAKLTNGGADVRALSPMRVQTESATERSAFEFRR